MLEVNRHTLPNGLRLVHSYDRDTAMVAVNTLYDVGTRDESRNLTGMAHLFEHLMFGGSAHVPAFDVELENAGGKSNAWTSIDFTNFYDTLPAQNIDTALHLESDRMLALDFSAESLRIQKGVVIEEFKQTHLDRPYGDAFHHIRRLLYAPDNAYSWPTIGLVPEHIERVTTDDVRRWFYGHYAPNNAILSIVGGIDFDTACRRAEQWYADVPARTIAPRATIDAGFPTAPVVETVYGRVPYTMIFVAYPMAPYGTPEYYAADTITDILSVGHAARLRNDLVNGTARGLISGADASIMGCEGPGFVLLMARMATEDDAEVARAQVLLREQVLRLTEAADLSTRELQRTINNFEASHRMANIGYTPLAANLAMAEYHGEDINATVDNRRMLTTDDITTAAENIFNRPSVTLIYRPDARYA